MNDKKGKLIVIEGSDGSGKTTQSKLLLDYLKSHKTPCAYISFPRYEASEWGKMIRRFLDGEFGHIDPYLASMLYAGDRFGASAEIKKWLEEGKIVVCNRYVGSNIGHMAAKFKSPADAKALAGRQSEREKYIQWLENFEYKQNGIPKEDLVILLQLDPKISRKLMKDRKLDIHEKDQRYQEDVFVVYDYVAGVKKNWVKVDCAKDGAILKPGQIAQLVVSALTQKKIF